MRVTCRRGAAAAADLRAAGAGWCECRLAAAGWVHQGHRHKKHSLLEGDCPPRRTHRRMCRRTAMPTAPHLALATARCDACQKPAECVVCGRTGMESAWQQRMGGLVRAAAALRRRQRQRRRCGWLAAAHGGANSCCLLTLCPKAGEGPQGGGGGHAAPLLLPGRAWLPGRRCDHLRCYCRAEGRRRWALPLARRDGRERARARVGLQRQCSGGGNIDGSARIAGAPRATSGHPPCEMRPLSWRSWGKLAAAGRTPTCMPWNCGAVHAKQPSPRPAPRRFMLHD